MSNSAVGGVYQSIIEEVINSSRVDFEESGVDESVLEELRKGWQQKLSQLDVARFPWDPKPDPPPPAPTAPAAPAASSQSQSQSQSQFSPDISLPSTGVSDGPAQNGIKAEPGLVKADPAVKQEPGSQSQQYAAYNGVESKNTVAASRAAQQLQMQYGMRAAGSINAIQDRMGQQQQQQPQQPQAGDAAGHPQDPEAANHVGNGQTDGAADGDGGIEGILLRHIADGSARELGRFEMDRLIHEQIAARAKAMEGGGLMMPLKEASKTRTSVRQNKGKGKGVATFDGGDDDEDDIDDEDAINSDLDDPEEDRDDDEVDDEGLGHIMLCMYDKVQRVKNKWKCTLKDGVLTVNGKEYVFHKATGEYEW
ncbi:hypothetical protein CP533_3890 [Ophiocordyceps camponoti-saundersi (nom. inval.)]|nr:hypothetical protein CP533_3890 [Ophiocordyceps camponoti-saundersi (nom. inval.)]